MTVSTISPARLAELCRQGKTIELVDVRTPAEFQEVHLDVARNVPLDRLDPAALIGARQCRPASRCTSSVARGAAAG